MFVDVPLGSNESWNVLGYSCNKREPEMIVLVLEQSPLAMIKAFDACSVAAAPIALPAKKSAKHSGHYYG